MKPKRTKSAGPTMAEIEDLITEILVQIPIKSLLRFKCVSKHWLSLISDPHFCASHTRFHQSLNPTTTALFLEDLYYTLKFPVIRLKSSPFTIEEFAVKDYLNVPSAKLLQSCNGLLLYRSNLLSFICNPTTRQFKKLSLSTIINEKLRIHGNELLRLPRLTVCLVFDPIISPHYKVIVIPDLFYLIDSATYWLEIWIYSSELDSWTSHRVGVDLEIFPAPSSQPLLGIYHYNQVYCNGSMHWLRCLQVSSLIRFDVDTLIFKKIDFPKDSDVCYFGESQGHLHCITRRRGYPELEYDVVEIASDYSGWIVRYHVNLQSIRKAYQRGDFLLLSIIRDKNGEDWTLLISVDKSPIAYDLSDGTHRRLYDSESKLAYMFYKAHPYIESLTCV